MLHVSYQLGILGEPPEHNFCILIRAFEFVSMEQVSPERNLQNELLDMRQQLLILRLWLSLPNLSRKKLSRPIVRPWSPHKDIDCARREKNLCAGKSQYPPDSRYKRPTLFNTPIYKKHIVFAGKIVSFWRGISGINELHTCRGERVFFF